MIQAKQELLQALARALAQLAPQAPPVAAFESPKQAAHGDLAITAAMPLARALKKNPRETRPGRWSQALQADPVVQRWVQALEIAGPGFVNLRLAPPRAGRGDRGAGRRPLFRQAGRQRPAT
jgi:arginyl-tRNA synthetase